MLIIAATLFVIVMNSILSNIELSDEEGSVSYRNSILRTIIIILYAGLVISYALGNRG